MIAGGAHPDDSTGYFDDLKEEINAQRLSDRVVITGYLENHEIPTIMAASDLVAAPFTSISNSGSILRSIAHRKPILIADLPWSRELGERCRGLTLFKAGDSADFASKVKELLGNKKLLVSNAAGSKEFADLWTVEKAAEMTLNVYKEILTNDSRD
jgi:glycosyltransferase involved in cell wall biosynthesis